MMIDEKVLEEFKKWALIVSGGVQIKIKRGEQPPFTQSCEAVSLTDKQI